ncbi:hypothetical protein [Azospirillum sp. B4]|uniref:hypothetical protein n=1 Tax=Azospirillum sp. B4 TaxID=95605 RepID=UPI0003462E22|nr:hypothetical protein [Azospirillum sp. B4]
MTTRTATASTRSAPAGSLAERLVVILPRVAAVVEAAGMLAVAAVMALCINAIL